jgi:hypothetical protein
MGTGVKSCGGEQRGRERMRSDRIREGGWVRETGEK